MIEVVAEAAVLPPVPSAAHTVLARVEENCSAHNSVGVDATEALNVTLIVVDPVDAIVPSQISRVPLTVDSETLAILDHDEGPPPDTADTVMVWSATRTTSSQAFPTVGLDTVSVVTPVPRLACRLPTAEIDTRPSRQLPGKARRLLSYSL
ncbi:hypothetical protein ACH4UM_18995 [Streptomyces sp. NPDC020801]|uniref:hypothetical protein n=1 Tax=Streptomyces sp. NPDC020801 TaxID=3365093 RepID=UPI0037923AEA